MDSTSSPPMENYPISAKREAYSNFFSFGVEIFLCLILAALVMWRFSLPPVSEARQFTVARGMSQEEIVERLREHGYIRGARMFIFFYFLRGRQEIVPGGYTIPEDTNAWELTGIFGHPPQMIWVTIPEGMRKEEIAEVFFEHLEWTEKDALAFLDAPESLDLTVKEGVYFPDTYLIDRKESGKKVAQRMINRFNEQLAPYQIELLRENIKWDTTLKIASLVQREAGGESDMPVIAAVIWNRLLLGMKLDIDATLQYALASKKAESLPHMELDGLPRASVEWWKPLSREAKNTDSSYNTYKVKGLPPEPIANPGLSALKAAIHPANSKCLYYLHDTDRIIHCAVTYEEHQRNIERYLR